MLGILLARGSSFGSAVYTPSTLVKLIKSACKYSASKAAMNRVTEALGIEEHCSGIRTMLVVPSRTKTNFRKNVLGKKRFAKLPFRLPESEPNSIANKIIKAMINGKSIYYTSISSRLYALVAGVAPSLINMIYKRRHHKFINSRK